MLGAALGAFAAPWLLLPWGGIPGAVRVAAIGNLLAGLGALVLARWARTEAPAPTASARRPPRAARRPPVRPLARALRALGVRGALARDPVVPPGGGRRQVHRLHLRHRARHLPARLGPGLPARGAARRARAGSARDVPALPVRDPARLGRLRHAARAPAARHAGLRVARRVLGHLPLLPLRARERSRAGAPPVRGAAALPVRAAHAADGLLVPGAAARGPRRAAHERAQGRRAAGGEHRGLRRGQPARRAGRARAAGDGRDAAAADARGPRLRRRRLALLRPPLRARGGRARARSRPSCPGARSSGGGSTARPAPRIARSSRKTRRASWP